MRQLKRTSFVLAMCLTATLTGGCIFLPEEDAAPEVELAETAAPVTVSCVPVERGTVQRTLSAAAQYAPSRSENLSFRAEGEKLAAVYVAVGDHVEAGQLLAELDAQSLAETVESLEYQESTLRLQLDALEEEYGQKQASLQLQQSEAPEDAQRQSAAQGLSAAAESYATQRQILNLRLGKVQSSLEEAAEKLEMHRVRASFSGTVAYLSDCAPGEIPQSDKVYVTVADETVSYFEIEGNAAADFPVGSAVSILCGDEAYAGSITGCSEDGTVAYAVPEDGEAFFDAGEKATVTLALETRENVLYLPSELIRQNGDASYVFLTDESGVFVMQEVKIGLVGDRTTEILSGLSEGTEVVSR